MSIWYVLLAIFVFGLLIFIHEFGHFMCARLCKVDIKEFSIGMGPKIIQWHSKKYDTDYSLRLLPIGGYVSMVGEDEDSDSENSFNKKSVWKRLLIVSAGPILNLLLGFMVMMIMLCVQGKLYSNTIYYYNTQTNSHITEIENITSQDNAVQLTLMSGDRVIKVGNVSVHTWGDLSYEITNQGYKPVDITVIRDGKTIKIENYEFRKEKDPQSGAQFGRVDFSPGIETFSFSNLIKHSFFRSISTVKMVVDSFVGLLSGRFGVESMAGPVGVTQTISTFASHGLIYFLYIFVIITINLGVFNLIPFPALDGGRILFLLIEAISHKKLNPKVEGYINFFGLMFMFLLAIFVTFNDILRLF